MVVCALAVDIPVGTDVESLGRKTDLGVARRFFSPGETAWIKKGRNGEAQKRFTALWTLKEAYIKARGKGLSMALDSAVFDLSFPGKIAFTGPGTGWRFFQFYPGQGHVASVALESLDPVRFDLFGCQPFDRIEPLGLRLHSSEE